MRRFAWGRKKGEIENHSSSELKKENKHRQTSSNKKHQFCCEENSNPNSKVGLIIKTGDAQNDLMKTNQSKMPINQTRQVNKQNHVAYEVVRVDLFVCS